MPKRILVGQIVSHSHKTALVRVKGEKRHELYGKKEVTFKKYASHDPENLYAKGEWVRIQESRPYSKTKHWEILDALQEISQRVGKGGAAEASVSPTGSTVKGDAS